MMERMKSPSIQNHDIIYMLIQTLKYTINKLIIFFILIIINGPPGPGGPGPRRTRYVGPGPGPPFEQVTSKHFFFLKCRFLVFGLKTIKNEGIRRFRWSDEICCEKLHLLVYITPPGTSFESSYDPNIMLMDDDGWWYDDDDDDDDDDGWWSWMMMDEDDGWPQSVWAPQIFHHLYLSLYMSCFKNYPYRNLA